MMKSAKVVIGGIVLWWLVAGASPLASQTEPAAGSLGPAYAKWLNEDVVYIVSPKERDTFLKLRTDKERDLFIGTFWKQRDPTQSTPENEFKIEHERRLAFANEHYAEGAVPGWKTESGRTYIIFGDTLKPAGWRMKMSVIEGVRTGAAEPPKAVTSSNLRYGLTATLKTEVGLAEALKQIEKTFNFGSARMLTEADFQWLSNKPEKDFHLFRLDGKEYAVFVTPIDPGRGSKFRLEVYEQGEKGKTNLLETEFAAREKTTTVFGFEDSKGTSYFLAFQMLGWLGETMVDGKLVRLPMAGQPPLGAGGEPVRAVGEVKPPKLIKQVDPVYPDIAKQARVEGVVILEATTDIYGRVQNIKVLRSIPLLDQAAIDAVRQWVYEPMVIEGKPRGMVFTTTVRFTLDAKPGEIEGGRIERVLPVERPSRVVGGVVGGVSGSSGGGRASIKIEANGVAPRLIKTIDPIYPEAAKKAKVSGTVKLEATIETDGSVKSIKVIRSIPLLDQAAIDALKQCKFDPIKVDGEPRTADITVTVNFSLPVRAVVFGGLAGGVEPVKITAAGAEPKLSTRVAPVYPEKARQARVEGVVILEATIDAHGKVTNTRILRSIPLLDKAAADAVKQWVYEPAVIDGKPKSISFTVTVRFQLAEKTKGAVIWSEAGGGVVGGVTGGVAGGVEGGTPEPIRATGKVQPPKLLFQVDPVYPEDARKAKVEGTVILEIQTDIYGRVASIKVLRSIPLLDQAAIDAVRQWVYEPLLINGKPRGCVFTVTVRFTLK